VKDSTLDCRYFINSFRERCFCTAQVNRIIMLRSHCAYHRYHCGVSWLLFSPPLSQSFGNDNAGLQKSL